MSWLVVLTFVLGLEHLLLKPLKDSLIDQRTCRRLRWPSDVSQLTTKAPLARVTSKTFQQTRYLSSSAGGFYRFHLSIKVLEDLYKELTPRPSCEDEGRTLSVLSTESMRSSREYP